MMMRRRQRWKKTRSTRSLLLLMRSWPNHSSISGFRSRSGLGFVTQSIVFLGVNHATAISRLSGSISTFVRSRTLSASSIRIARSSVMPKYSLRSSRETCDS